MKYRLILGILVVAGFIRAFPRGFLPVEDQGYFFAVIQLPDGTSLQRTDVVAGKVREILARRFPSRLRYVP
jgi:multidrug efflux pump subunit AcrB